MSLLLPNEHQMSMFSVDGEKPSVVNKKIIPEKKVHHVWQIYTDGASRGNPGAAGAGIFVSSGENEILKVGFYLGSKTNNQAEYLALLLGLWVAKNKSEEMGLQPEFVIISDSELLVRQMNGIYKVKNELLLALKNVAIDLLKGVKYKIKHVLRHNNLQADKLANHGVDKKIKIPTGFLKFLANYNIFIETL